MTGPAQVAVVIPCHNAAEWLAETLDSVAQQTLAPAEVVVVDDGSTDASAEVARQRGVRCVQQDCGGPAAARNRGIRETSAPWLAFLDADDRFAPEKLAAQVAQLAASGAALSCTDAWVLRGDERGGRKNQRRTVPASLHLESLIAGNPIICSTVVVRRDAVCEVGGFDEDPVLIATEDYDLWLRLAQAGHHLTYLDRPLLDYRMTPGQLSDDRRFLRGVDRIMAKLSEGDAAGALAQAVRHRRASVRLDAAYQLARRKGGKEARRWLREARDLGAGPGVIWRTWLRSWFP